MVVLQNWTCGVCKTRIIRMSLSNKKCATAFLSSLISSINESGAESGDAGDAPIMEEGVDGVRIMTVHKAKGLEFPVVLLADITAKDTREPARWVDQTAGLSAIELAG